MAIEIKLSRGKVAIIDDADFELVSMHKWYAVTPSRSKTWYAYAKVRRSDGTRIAIKMHRLLLGLTDPEIKTDHIDGDGLNNQRTNLRTCSNAQNMRNKGVTSANKSGFKGVSWHKQRGKWQATIMVNRKQKFLGYHDTKEAAYEAYCNAAADLHGEFNNLGNPPPKRWTKPAFEYITGAQR